VISTLHPRAMAALLPEEARPASLERLSARLDEGWGAVMLYRVLRPAHLPEMAHHLQLIADPARPLVEGNHLFASTSGRLDGISIDSAGTVRANYTNGQQEALGKLILANFASPNGLKQIGNANYVATSNSGDAVVGVAGSDGYGTIQGGALERANVDLTEELVNLITAQRNFQANAKAIETATNLTSTIVNIRG
jgi:flagellar basal body rod protein FlgG